MTYRFGTFEFDSALGELRKNGRTVALEPQPARALALLLTRADEVVTREELRDAVWGSDTHVDFDRGLAYCLSQIRFALGDGADNPRFVQTLPRKGYRFIAPVQVSPPVLAEAASPAPPTDVPAPVARTRLAFGLTAAVLAIGALAIGWAATRRPPAAANRVVIAVSVFDNETGMAEHDRLVAGLSDVVVTDLTRLDPARIGVIGNAAVLRQPRNIRNLAAISKDVRADYVVLGQLQRADPGLRFITHFIRLSDSTHLKANRIAMPDGNVSGLEDAVTAEFERAVREHVLTAGR